MTELRRLRSVLLTPGNNTDVLAQVSKSRPDAVVLDLAEGIGIASKDEARAGARNAATVITTDSTSVAVFTRVSALGSPWFEQDIASLHPHLAGVVVPRMSSASDVTMVREALANVDLPRMGIIAGLETVAGVDASRDILHGSSVVACYFGADTFIADIGGMRTAGNTEVLYARSRVAMTARAAGVLAVDQPMTNGGDDVAFRSDVLQGKAIGYDGKMCVTSDHIILANEVYTPSDAAVGRAQRLVAAYETATQQGDMAIEFEGRIVDAPVADQARQLLNSVEG